MTENLNIKEKTIVAGSKSFTLLPRYIEEEIYEKH
jgi:hypothetical protein